MATDNTTVVAYIKKEGGMKSGPLCVLLWRILTLYQETGNSQSLTHPRPAECDCRQATQARSDHPDRMVPSSRGLSNHMLLVAPAPSGPFCHQVQQHTATVCVTGSRPPGVGSGCTKSVLGRSGPV